MSRKAQLWAVIFAIVCLVGFVHGSALADQGALQDIALAPTPASPAPPQPLIDNDGDGIHVPADCNDHDDEIYPGATEACNGLDDDCDGMADETFAGLGNACTAGMGECEDTGEVVCTGDELGTECDATAGSPTAEVCDGLDNDCNGTTDDGFGTGVACEGEGECGAGVIECLTSTSTVCSTDPGGSADESSAELCATGLDEDCDGAADETAGTIRYVRAGGSDAGNACDVALSPCLTIQHAIDVACVDDTVDIGAGIFTEDVSLYKRLTLDGAGAGTTTVTPATGGSDAIHITATGLGLSPVAIKDLTVSGATSGADGIVIAAPGTNFDFDHVEATGNANAGIAIDTGGAVSDVSVSASALSMNGLYGLLVTSSNDLTGLGLTGGTVNDNGYNGVATLGNGVSTNVTGVTIDGTSFSGNGVPSVTGGEGDISLFLFNGDATIQHVSIVADGRIALQLRGRAGPFAPAGTVVLDDVSISGSTSFSAISMLNYSSVAGISFSAVSESTASPFGLFLEALGTTLDLSDTAFDGVHGAQRTIANVSTGAVDATGASFSGVGAATATLAELFVIEDQIGHSIDVSGGGLVRVRDLNVYVTPASFAPPFTTVARIQRGIDAATPGDTVNIADATYRENVIANKSVTLDGQSQATTIIMPEVSSPDPCAGSSLCGGAASNIILVESDSVTIQDLTLDGDNDLVVSGVDVFGADVDARNGIIQNFLDADAPFDDLTVHHVSVKSVYLRGIQVSDGSGFDIHHNTVENVRGEAGSIALFNFGAAAGSFSENTVLDCLDGVVANSSRGTSFTTNHVTCDPAMAGSGMSGIHTDNAGDGGGPGDLLDGNDVSDCDNGIFVFLPYVTPTVSGNTITNSDVGLALYGGAVPPSTSVTTIFSGNDLDGGVVGGSIGFLMSTTSFGLAPVSDTIATFDDNTIQNYAVGVQVEEDAGDASKSNALTGSGNTLTLNDTGVLVTASADSGTVVLDGNRIYDNTDGFTNDSGTVLASATCTWWGTINGPQPEPMGGNPVTTPANVDYMPWAANFALMDVELWPDGDGDGFGDSGAVAVLQCGPPFGGYVQNNGDCDDAVAAINPDATEICDGIDDDCDMSLNNAPAVDSCADVSCATKSCSALGACEYDGTCDIAGNVYYYRVHTPGLGTEPSTKPVPDVTILRTSSVDPDATDITDPAGSYSIPTSGGDVTLEPQSLDATEEECDAYISALDATRIAQHAVHLITLTTNQQVAANVSGNTTGLIVTSFDASLVAQKSVAVPCTTGFSFPVATTSDWAFAPLVKTFTPLVGTENYDFLAIMYGDVTGNWEEHLPPNAAAPPDAESATAEAGAPLVLPTTYGRDDAAVVYLSELRRIDGQVQVTLGLEAADGIQGLDLSLLFDPATVTVTEVRTASLAEGFTLTTNDLGGTQALSLFSSTPMAGTGDFLVITVAIHGPASSLPFKVLGEANEGQIPLRFDLGPAAPGPVAEAGQTLGGGGGTQLLQLKGN